MNALLDAAPRGRHPCIRDRNKRSLTPLGEAIASGRPEVARLLVTKVCSIDLSCKSSAS